MPKNYEFLKLLYVTVISYNNCILVNVKTRTHNCQLMIIQKAQRKRNLNGQKQTSLTSSMKESYETALWFNITNQKRI